MLIVPELETVIIMPPRTGSRSLRLAVKERYPEAMQIYRHMEADGIPQGYERYRRIGFVRQPLHRLWSLYHYLKDIANHPAEQDYPAWAAYQKASVDRDFEDWLINNETVFTDPYMQGDPRFFYPRFNVRHRIPENRKSQWLYLRPDLGTVVYDFVSLGCWALENGLDLGHHHRAGQQVELPTLSHAGEEHLARYHGWDLKMAVTLP